jgi:ubiquinone/menaquinone biosynthesis C-methylase UbiE
MRREWDERARKNPFHYIHTGRDYWDDEGEFFGTGERLVQEWADPFIHCHINSPEQCVALDVGCGVGRVTRALSRRFRWVYGVDVSSEMIERAKAINTAFTNISFYQNDGETLNLLEDSSIDYVFSFVTFQHMPSYNVIQCNIKEISRVLKPGGALQVDFLILAGWHRIFGVIPVPRSIKVWIPSWVLQSYRRWTVADPLKRTVTFGGVALTKGRTEKLFSDFGLACKFQNDPSSPSKVMVQGVKRKGRP